MVAITSNTTKGLPMGDLELKLDSVDSGFCRVYYKNTGREGDKRLFCMQEEGKGQFDLLVCSPDGEPDYSMRLDNIKTIEAPDGPGSLDQALCGFLSEKGLYGAQDNDAPELFGTMKEPYPDCNSMTVNQYNVKVCDEIVETLSEKATAVVVQAIQLFDYTQPERAEILAAVQSTFGVHIAGVDNTLEGIMIESTGNITVDVTDSISFTAEDICAIVTAFVEQRVGDWVKDFFGDPEQIKAVEDSPVVWWGTVAYFERPDWSFTIVEDDGSKKGKRCIVTAETLAVAFRDAGNKYPHILRSFWDDNYGAEDADAIIQMAALGDIIYG